MLAVSKSAAFFSPLANISCLLTILVCFTNCFVSLWSKPLSKNDTAMWHEDHLYPHSSGYVLSHPIMVDQRWELSRPPQTDMNFKVVIWPKMSINRSHLMPTSCLSVCTHPHNGKHTLPPINLRTLCSIIASASSPSLHKWVTAAL